MISYYYKTEIEELLAKILSSSSIKGMLSSTIQDRLLMCPILKELENSSISFLFNKMPEEIFKETFGFDGVIEDIDVNDLWVAKSYLDLFFEYKKPFSYLFTVIPLGMMYANFETLHIVGEDFLYRYYERKENEKSLLSRLISLRNLSIHKLAVVTGISYNTIEKYTRDNKFIYTASFENIYKLSKALDVSENIFIRKLDIDVLEERDINSPSIVSNELIDNIIFYSFLYQENMLAKKSYIYDKNARTFTSNSTSFLMISLEDDGDNYAKLNSSSFPNIIVFDRHNEIILSKIKMKENQNVYVINATKIYKLSSINNVVSIGEQKDIVYINRT